MPNKSIQRNTMIELLTRVPVNRGSLLKSIDHLLKTIETSENAVMIPTLLKDKVRVDAWELLFVAKILRASVLGHSDLVEFYLNHIHNNSQHGAAAAAAGESCLVSPAGSISRQQSSPNMATTASSPVQARTSVAPPTLIEGLVLSSAPANTSTTMPTTGGAARRLKQPTVSWTPAAAAASVAAVSVAGGPAAASASLSSSSFTSACSSTSTSSPSASSSSSASSSDGATPTAGASPPRATFQISDCSPPASAPALSPRVERAAPDAAPGPGPVPVARQPQPPSLLQLTTTNNHINSVSELLNGTGGGGNAAASPLSPSLEQLTSHLIQLQQQAAAAAGADHAQSLTISTTGGSASAEHQLSGATAGAGPGAAAAAAAAAAATRHELRSSRSAGCLFRANSGASSPRTPGTPYPQAETLAGAGPAGLAGDPSSLVKLLLQVEQLKTSIVQVTSLLDSVVELYKKSIDNIAS